MNVPESCSLSGDDATDRVGEWRRLSERALLARSVVEGGAKLVYRQEAENELRRLVALEHGCCGHFGFDVATDGDGVVLTVLGPGPEVAAFL